LFQIKPLHFFQLFQINIPLIENNRLYNRLNNNKYIDLIIGKYYKLDIRFELVGSIKMPKILIDYFSN
jgi:hypothetical protein